MQTLLNADLQNQIREFLAPMKEKVTLVLFTQESPCETCTETRQLLKEISSLNDKITFVEKDLYEDIRETDLYGITLTPSFVMLDSEGQYRGVKFNGIPAGHEINSFLSAIIDMSGVDFGFDQNVIERIKKIDKKVNIKVFVTLSCPHCPGAVMSAHRLAMLNSNIEGEMIEAQTFYNLSEQYNVSGVPKIVINEKHELLGNQPIEAFLNQLENL
ncbi:MAG: glutaredoxin [Tenericutes bacterium GWC2_34_14]|nr:MAG: glutaredoxin [Tenericutes bacterium GWC2_34_14]OHE33062.1 MAG: glutaredoxin [Tenericutes bacterium GWE2_34_108]OHE36182.1 MAG: glutaredoxin [Tenericutes bacterium GWF1_35_14]OHE38775.1 MAG: glutaredoxin [Tenericutes bacterium GWF2_35_184]OHE42623.1 MAG: glutaredoxin [Tenericutes bacterium RIFOXYA12_FULL_35_10]OHE44724.1 MAG: glutaredoxin [Tenericutes bacterium RIFOXYA2_FULL_36_32]OHE48445.1 MAG: glutaredoxin [Tenericutes bacterium RIFOXYB2_FULL_36_25]OHE49534.1 MAG: glutaredoxin [Ten